MTHLYADGAWLRALDPDGEAPLSVDPWGATVRVRRFGPGLHDAAGAYPVCPIRSDADVPAGLAILRAWGLVSVVLVTDVLCGPPAQALAPFDVARPFKKHWLVDLARPSISKHHRYEIRRAARACVVDEVRLVDHLDAWNTLYGALVARHRITGVQAFSRAAFEALARHPSIVTLRAREVDGPVLGMHVFALGDGTVHSHLAATSGRGYDLGAGYAIHAAALERFRGRGLMDLGGAAGLEEEDTGLARFKAGFASETREAWLCGAVLDPRRYGRLAAGREGGYFPIYRAPDLARTAAA